MTPTFTTPGILKRKYIPVQTRISHIFFSQILSLLIFGNFVCAEVLKHRKLCKQTKKPPKNVLEVLCTSLPRQFSLQTRNITIFEAFPRILSLWSVEEGFEWIRATFDNRKCFLNVESLSTSPVKFL